MIKIENFEVLGWDHVIRGMRNPMNSWDKSDSGICKGGDDGIGCENCAMEVPCTHSYDHSWQLGKADHELMRKLSTSGPVHAKYRRMVTVYLDIIAPLYWWKEFDTYRVGVTPNPADIEMNSCSTMHKIHAKEFTLEDFSHEHLVRRSKSKLEEKIEELNFWRNIYLYGGYESNEGKNYEPKDKEAWWQMIQLLPSSYNQKRTVKLNYEVLSNVYQYRKEHKLDEWREFCQWIEQLPYSEIITCNAEEI